MSDSIQRRVSDYYTGKLKSHGASHWGVDWNSTESQVLRFEQLCRVIDQPAYSVLDYGCGYGALIDYLDERGGTYTYTGYDIAPAMIEAARGHYAGRDAVRFTASVAELQPADYIIASGIFNVKMDISNESWHEYIQQTVDMMWGLARRGIAFNALTSYSDAEYMRDDLHYADPLHWFDHFKRHKTRQVALLHDYGLYEFTLLARRDERSPFMDRDQVGDSPQP